MPLPSMVILIFFTNWISTYKNGNNKSFWVDCTHYFMHPYYPDGSGEIYFKLIFFVHCQEIETYLTNKYLYLYKNYVYFWIIKIYSEGFTQFSMSERSFEIISDTNFILEEFVNKLPQINHVPCLVNFFIYFLFIYYRL